MKILIAITSLFLTSQALAIAPCGGIPKVAETLAEHGHQGNDSRNQPCRDRVEWIFYSVTIPRNHTLVIDHPLDGEVWLRDTESRTGIAEIHATHGEQKSIVIEPMVGGTYWVQILSFTDPLVFPKNEWGIAQIEYSLQGTQPTTLKPRFLMP